MPAVVHRSMQRHGATGSQVPIRLRTCPNCQIVFKSKTGLFQHQSRKKNVGCFRAGILRLRHTWIKKRNDYHSTWRKKQVPELSRYVKSWLYHRHHQKHRLGLLTVRRKETQYGLVRGVLPVAAGWRSWKTQTRRSTCWLEVCVC